MKKRNVYIAGLLMLSLSGWAEYRIWTDAEGGSIEAEFVTEASGVVSLRKRDGGTLKIRRDLLSDADRTYLETAIPPKLTIKIGSKRDENSQGGISREYVTCSAEISKSGYSSYTGELEARLFVFAQDEMSGDYVLVRRTSEKFTMAKEKSGQKEVRTDRIELRSGEGSYDYGADYDGCLAVVYDQNGRIVCKKANRAFYEQNAEKIQELSEKNAFNKDLEVTQEHWRAGQRDTGFRGGRGGKGGKGSKGGKGGKGGGKRK